MSEVAFIFDSDALIQIFISNQQRLFATLLDDFNVRSYLMSEVEVELGANRKFGGLIRPKLAKALNTGQPKVLSASDLDRLVGDESAVSLADIRELGSDYALDVGKGEAYTHAAGVLLNTPTVSNDMNAIRTLEGKGKKLPPTILLSFDLFGFMHSEGYIDKPAAEQILKELKAQAEWMPPDLRNSSFEDGIKRINCRLLTSLAITASSLSWSAPFYLKRKLSSEDNGQD